jgi:hypothetical protein
LCRRLRPPSSFPWRFMIGAIRGMMFTPLLFSLFV